ncbi:MAG: hypothetical protein KKH12_08180 [Gammaproteobacteria bacterium]|nr:hypothetical protein [Gammaproteobacteria bacterium]MBU1481640.1 hypothetical protein [Gammaproteobacteria bacterium]
MRFSIWLCITATLILQLAGCGGSTTDSTYNPAIPTLSPPATWESEFTLPQQDANGWSILTPSSDSRLIYVSTSGDDGTAQYYASSDAEIGNDPFNPVGAVLPYASLDTALAQARAGYPDYILLRRGDTWTRTAAISMKAGRSATERMVLAYYGANAARPIVKNYGLNLWNASYSAVVGIQFTASQRNPASPDFVGFANITNIAGFDGLGGYNNSLVGGLLIEDCWFDWFSGNVLQSPQTTAPVLTDMIVRRNIITNNYSTAGHAQGLYSARASILLEENIFDHNGWYKQGDSNFSDQAEGKATMFNHNTYFSEARDTIFRNNLFLRASSSGNKFTSNTPSGTNQIKTWNLQIENNLYVEGEVGISLGGNDDQNNGPRWENIHVTNNVLTHIGRTQPTLRTLGWGLDVQDWNGGKVTNNIFAHWGDATLSNNYAIHAVGHSNDVNYTDNVVYNIPSGGTLVQFLDGATHLRVTFTANDIWTDSASQLLSYSLTGNAGFGDNHFHSTRNEAQWFRVNDSYASLAQYQAASGDTTSVADTRTYVAPERTVETYLASLTLATDMDSFAAELKQQSKFNWRPALTAEAINAYIRAGFCISGNAGCR